MPGRLVHRYDLRALVRAAHLYGGAAGVADTAMNAHPVPVEERYGRSVMSRFHGFWSVGGLAGSGIAAIRRRDRRGRADPLRRHRGRLAVVAAGGGRGPVPSPSTQAFASFTRT
ncbi:hypothetical protein ACIA5C_18875 [Actinoplanes sp. NPDC051343]|uniref:hypothetical protein n=1 Tax=Actinoplanes sp. NPDC051343 TaxID=3363906 RepID=UPI0037B3A163